MSDEKHVVVGMLAHKRESATCDLQNRSTLKRCLPDVLTGESQHFLSSLKIANVSSPP